MSRYSLETLAIDVSNVCNFRCRMCESHGGEVIKGQSPMTVGMPRFIDEGLFKKIVSEYKALRQPGTKYVTPQYRGEALLHPRFLDLCAYIDDAGLPFGFSTNAALLTEKKSRELVKLRNFVTIQFSVDGSTAETFNKIRLRGDYKQVVQNIEQFLDIARERLRKKTFQVGINFAVQPDNEREVDDFVRQWVDRASFLTLGNLSVEGRPAKTFFMPERVPCREPQANMIVLTNGDTVTCCRDYWFTMRLGNVAKQSLEEVWNGPKYQELRDRHESGKWNTIPLCADCDSWSYWVGRRSETRGGLYIETSAFTKFIRKAPTRREVLTLQLKELGRRVLGPGRAQRLGRWGRALLWGGRTEVMPTPGGPGGQLC